MYKFLFWNRKITPEVLRIDQYCEKFLGMLASKSFFNVRFGVTAFAKFVTLSVIDDFRIISVINRVANQIKSNQIKIFIFINNDDNNRYSTYKGNLAICIIIHLHTFKYIYTHTYY